MSKDLSYANLISQSSQTSLFAVSFSYDYASLSINDHLFNKPMFKADIMNQDEIPTDWDKHNLGMLHFMRLSDLTGDADSPLEDFFINQSLTLTSFFASQMIDIPLCLKNVKSLYSATMSTPELRLITMIMRHGRRSYVSKHYANSLHHLSTLRQKNLKFITSAKSWQLHYSALSHLSVISTANQTGSYSTSPLPLDFTDNYAQEYHSPYELVRSDNWFQELLFSELVQYTPVFSFYVTKVDKMKRKHSRGKTGKYSIGWKFIPKYKRLLIVLRWLVRDIRFQKSKTLNNRILKSFENLLFDKSSHLVYQLRNFVHRFVFQNYKKTLLRTLKSAL